MKDSFFTKQKVKNLINSALEKNDVEGVRRALYRLQDKSTFLKKLKDDKKLKIIELCKNDFDEITLLPIVESLSSSAKLQILGNTSFLSIIDRAKVVDSMPTADAEEALRLLKIKDAEADIVIQYLQHDDLKFYAIENLNLDKFSLGSVLESIKDIDCDKFKTKLVSYFASLGISQDAQGMALRVLKNYGSPMLVDLHEQGILKPELVGIFGEENLYEMFKNYKRELINFDLQDIIQNADAFNKYKKLRDTFSQKQTVVGKDDISAIRGFIKNKSLILSCIDSELSLEERKLLTGVLCEKDGVFQNSIQSREQLTDFPKTREQVIADLIKNNPEDAMCYLLTGMTAREHKRNSEDYLSPKKTESTIKYFDKSSDRFTSILVVEEMIAGLKKMPKEKIQEILTAWNKELTNEFSGEGSTIATLRNAFRGAVDESRRLYGEDLSNALQENPLPDPVPSEKDKDVQIINLTGQKFKLIIHGLNAFGNIGQSSFDNQDNGKSYLCTSLISEKCLGRANAKVYYGFGNVSANAFINDGGHDIYSGDSPMANADEIGFGRGSAYNLSANDLVRSTFGYNEVDLMREYIDEKGNKQTTEPNYIVCFDFADSESIDAAKKSGLPIVVIDTKAYESQIQAGRKEQLDIDKLPFSENAQNLYNLKKQQLQNLAVWQIAQAAVVQQSLDNMAEASEDYEM